MAIPGPQYEHNSASSLPYWPWGASAFLKAGMSTVELLTWKTMRVCSLVLELFFLGGGGLIGNTHLPNLRSDGGQNLTCISNGADFGECDLGMRAEGPFQCLSSNSDWTFEKPTQRKLGPQRGNLLSQVPASHWINGMTPLSWFCSSLALNSLYPVYPPVSTCCGIAHLSPTHHPTSGLRVTKVMVRIWGLLETNRTNIHF